MTAVRAALGVLVAATALVGCGGSESSSVNDRSAGSTGLVADTGIRLVEPAQAAATIADPPVDLVILDVRTVAEFDESRLKDAVMLDFYREDFVDRLAEFDHDVPYVLYCRSGNRSRQVRVLMEELGFTDVQDIDGGIEAWELAGFPTVTG